MPFVSKRAARRAPLLRKLVAERQFVSLMEKEFAIATQDFTFSRDDWVPMWVDNGNTVISDDGTCKALRGITTSGQLVWLVFRDGKSRGFHSTQADPFAAIAEAKRTWQRRKDVRRDWGTVRRVSRALLTGRMRFDVRMEDAEASPLCTLGIEGFLRGIGLPQARRIPGWSAAALLLVDDQIGFVIYEAYLRHQSEGAFLEDDTGLAA